jgi:hypothetical protein
MTNLRPSDDLRIPVTVLIGVRLTAGTDCPAMETEISGALSATSMKLKLYKSDFGKCLVN